MVPEVGTARMQPSPRQKSPKVRPDVSSRAEPIGGNKGGETRDGETRRKRGTARVIPDKLHRVKRMIHPLDPGSSPTRRKRNQFSTAQVSVRRRNMLLPRSASQATHQVEVRVAAHHRHRKLSAEGSDPRVVGWNRLSGSLQFQADRGVVPRGLHSNFEHSASVQHSPQ